MGALALYISNESVADFQPMNINFGIIPPLDHRVKGKRNKNAELSQRALQALEGLQRYKGRSPALPAAVSCDADSCTIQGGSHRIYAGCDCFQTAFPEEKQKFGRSTYGKSSSTPWAGD